MPYKSERIPENYHGAINVSFLLDIHLKFFPKSGNIESLNYLDIIQVSDK